jgi:hypothetical protein
MRLETKDKSVQRDVLLYDEARLLDLRNEYGAETEIKLNVETSATLYEIRTAIRFWTDGQRSHRTSDRIWKLCKGVQQGMYEVENGELVNA